VADYSILINRSAQKEIEAIDSKAVRRKIVARIQDLAGNPRPPGCQKLSGSDYFRIRQGSYRIIYKIEDDVLTVLIVRVGHRRNIYR
jgi:mRNA interferase RelE/StbE